MTIGVKYCGGCNPRYDRREILRKLERDFPGHTVRAGAGEVPPGFAVVVCGCPSRCADHREFDGAHGKQVVWEPEQYGELRRRIDTILI